MDSIIAEVHTLTAGWMQGVRCAMVVQAFCPATLTNKQASLDRCRVWVSFTPSGTVGVSSQSPFCMFCEPAVGE
eukprot:scaffold16733_cov112-Isochrysis_galbana.AAC.5